MRKIYNSIDIGTNEIKVVTIEQFNDKYNVLASSSVKSAGVKKGLITDATLVTNAIKRAVKSAESKLGSKIDKILAIVPSNNIEIEVVTGKIKINNEDNIITGSDIFSCLNNAIKDNVRTDMEVVSVSPVEFKIGTDKKIKNPLGLEGKDLAVRAVMSMVPKKNVYSVVSVLESLNIEVIDVCFSSISDYYVAKTKDLDEKIIAMVNIGESKTNIAVFNKGVIIKDSNLPIGGLNIDNDISFSYKTNLDKSKEIKETFAVSNRKYADSGEVMECINRLDEKIEINQYRIAELVEARIKDILKNIKNELNSLTNKEIQYIIITGGITSMLGFSAIVEEVFPKNADVISTGLIGIRDNKYSSSYGIIKYFQEKLDMREKDYSMFSGDKIEDIVTTNKKIGQNNVLSKIFEKIFE